jgi:hypothetical protein
LSARPRRNKSRVGVTIGRDEISLIEYRSVAPMCPCGFWAG